MTDPHLLTKIATATSGEELDGIRKGFTDRGEEPPSEAVQALARRRAELAKAVRR